MTKTLNKCFGIPSTFLWNSYLAVHTYVLFSFMLNHDYGTRLVLELERTVL